MLLLEIFHKNKPASEVPEYAEVELRLTNRGATPLHDCVLELAGRRLRENMHLSPGSGWSVTYNVDDLVGELTFEATCPEGEKASANLRVVPQKLSWEDVLYIKVERLPTVLARLDAPNGFTLRYGDEQEREFDFFSPDFTAEKLRHYSAAFLEEGLGEKLVEKLDYATPARQKGGLGKIRGPVRWPATVENWLNHPEQAGLRHEWVSSPKTFATLPNLLFARFQLELAGQMARLEQFVKSGVTASGRLLDSLPAFASRARQHLGLLDSPYLVPIKEAARTFQPRSPELAQELERECLEAANPAYASLWELWQDFATRYVALPEEEDRLARCGMQPMSKIYELWAACEVAVALGLKFDSGSGETLPAFSGESAIFSGPDYTLYYNRGISGGWYSATRSGVARPDLRLERRRDGFQLFLDVKYRVYPTPGGTERARPDDVYKLLAYMNDFGVGVGGILYPGQATPSVIESEKGQRLLEIPLRPPVNGRVDGPEALHRELRSLILDQFPSL